MVGNVSNASPVPNCPKDIGSHSSSPPNLVAESALLLATCCGAKAAADAARAAKRAKESLAMVDFYCNRMIAGGWQKIGQMVRGSRRGFIKRSASISRRLIRLLLFPSIVRTPARSLATVRHSDSKHS